MALNALNADDTNMQILGRFENEMNNDFATPRVISLIDKLVKDLNKDFDGQTYASLMTILNTLGIEPKIQNVHDKDIEIYKLWQTARLNKDYEHADTYRKHLQDKGFI